LVEKVKPYSIYSGEQISESRSNDLLSSTSWSDCKLLSIVVNGHMMTVCFVVCCWLHSQTTDLQGLICASKSPFV